MPEEIRSTITTGCKINLFLTVGPRLPDGYHVIDTFFLPLAEPHDTLHILLSPPDGGQRPGITVDCGTPGIDLRNNTLTRAYEAYAGATGYAPSVFLRLQKGVPHGAGLGGGSANAAGLLMYLRECQERDGSLLPQGELNRIAATVGADTPFFLLNVPARAGGIGECLSPAPNPFAGQTLVLICPDIRISTAWAFGELDALRQTRDRSGPGVENIPGLPINSLTRNASRATTCFSHGMRAGNDFEEVVFRAFPVLQRLCDALREKGAQTAQVSGTGSSVFGLFARSEAARTAAESIAADSFGVVTTYVQTV